MSSRAVALAAAALSLAAGCSTFKVSTPAAFVELPDQEPNYDYRATTHDGVVVSVRSLDNDPRGDQAFWTRAVEQRVRHQGGYALLDNRAVTARDGLTGRQLRFGHDEGARPHLYNIAMFVTHKRIYLIETGGGRDAVQREAPKLDAFVAQFEPRRCWFKACVPLVELK
jgi:hypothetical protein